MIVFKQNKVVHALRENCPNTEFFWSAFSRIWTEYEYLSVFSPNAGKYGPEITLYLDIFHAVIAKGYDLFV